MIPLSHTSRATTEEAVKRAMGVAEHYGFLPVEEILPEFPEHATRRVPAISQLQHFSPFDAELARIMHSFIEHGHSRLSEPVLFYHQTLPTQKNAGMFFGLHVIGSAQSIAEALLMRTALAMLDDLGVASCNVHINSIGDRDSTNRFTKELTAHLRKNLNELPGYSRQAMKKDVLYAFSQLVERRHTICLSAPCTVEFLTEHSRQHFRQVLEYFDLAGIPYTLAPTLIGNRECYSKTLFEVRSVSETEEETHMYGRGGRYDELAKRLFKKEVPAVSVVFEYEKKGRLTRCIPPKSQKRRPKVYFIQLGFDAQLRSLEVMEVLRKARIPVYQTLGKDQLGAQLELADRLAIPYSMIMGHKEVLDGTIIVRDMDSRAQHTVPVGELVGYLRTIL